MEKISSYWFVKKWENCQKQNKNQKMFVKKWEKLLKKMFVKNGKNYKKNAC